MYTVTGKLGNTLKVVESEGDKTKINVTCKSCEVRDPLLWGNNIFTVSKYDFNNKLNVRCGCNKNLIEYTMTQKIILAQRRCKGLPIFICYKRSCKNPDVYISCGEGLPDLHMQLNSLLKRSKGIHDKVIPNLKFKKKVDESDRIVCYDKCQKLLFKCYRCIDKQLYLRGEEVIFESSKSNFIEGRNSCFCGVDSNLTFQDIDKIAKDVVNTANGSFIKWVSKTPLIKSKSLFRWECNTCGYVKESNIPNLMKTNFCTECNSCVKNYDNVYTKHKNRKDNLYILLYEYKGLKSCKIGRTFDIERRMKENKKELFGEIIKYSYYEGNHLDVSATEVRLLDTFRYYQLKERINRKSKKREIFPENMYNAFIQVLDTIETLNYKGETFYEQVK